MSAPGIPVAAYDKRPQHEAEYGDRLSQRATTTTASTGHGDSRVDHPRAVCDVVGALSCESITVYPLDAVVTGASRSRTACGDAGCRSRARVVVPAEDALRHDRSPNGIADFVL